MQKTNAKISILFVCLGNICRSPMAEGLFIEAVKEAGFSDKIEIASAGTGNWHIGELPDERMRKTALEHNIELISRARQITIEDFAHYDYILAADKTNLKNINELYADYKGANQPTFFLMRAFDRGSTPQENPQEVPDPYFGGEEGFEACFQILKNAMQNLLIYLQSKHNF
ncbi:MAG: low molecular weight phosphotyrosine protein phosphatase [Bernardetiaceae bacterium]|nr:low molecular weight phosphotyrosine protein phosphatase [Bernardetiaceae bacterium]